MFDISFSEFLVIAVVALIVIGPERLPKVARTFGLLFARAQRYVHDIKIDIAREIETEELKRTHGEIKTVVRSVERSVAQEATNMQTQLDKVVTVSSTPAADAAQQARKQT